MTEAHGGTAAANGAGAVEAHASAATELFAGPGEMRTRCRAHDWAATPLGPVEGWPQSLRTAVALCLASGFPMLVMWGPELVQLYNDAFRAVLQAKHPAGLGQRARDCWPELWEMIGPMYRGVLETGESVFLEDQLFTPERQGEAGRVEEAYFTFSYSAIPDEAHRPAGILATVFETTRHVQSRGERERALERANAELRTAAAERERLLVEAERARAEAEAARGVAERTAAALAGSEARFRTVQEASPHGLVLLRPERERAADGGAADEGPGVTGRIVDFRIQYANPAGARLTGQHPDAMVGRTLLGLFPATRDLGLFDAYVRVMETGAPWENDVRYVADGLAAGYRLAAVRVGDGAAAELVLLYADATVRLAADAERARLLAQLGAERERLRSLVLHMPTPVALHEGPELRFTLVNDAYKRASGGGRDVTGLTPQEAFPELVGQGFYEQLARVYATGEAWLGPETPVRLDRDGAGVQDTWFTLRYEPLRDGAGRVTGVLQLAVDVTDQVGARREVERLLADSERARADAEAARAAADLARGRLEALLEHLPVGVTLAEAPSGRLLVSNRAVREIWGLDTPAAQVAEYSALYVGLRPGPEPEAERRYASDAWPLARALASGEAVMDELIEILRPDGTRVLASVSAAPVRDASGAVVGGIVMTQDVTERERLLADERAARERTERLQALTAALAGVRTLADVADVVVADMAVTLGARTGALAGRDADGGALALLRTVGFPEPLAADVRRQPLGLASPLTDCFRTQAPVWIESRVGPEGLDARYPRIAPFWDALGVESAVFVPLIAGGEAVGVISFSFQGPRAFGPADRAFFAVLGQQAALAVERSRLFDAERAARTEAEAANRAKSEFLATMSHELRTPLNAIGGYAELIEFGIHGPVTEAQRTALERIQRSQRHLLGLIAGVLDYSRVEAGAVTYRLADVPVVEAIAEAELLVAPQLRAKGLGCAWSGAASGLRVHADREKLQQILLNLLSNAVKFTDVRDGVPGRIEVSCDLDAGGAGGAGAGALGGDGTAGGRVRICVRDTGAGIAAEALERIFEPFVQADQRLTRPHAGVGLGLAISRDLARGMGGDLTVESTPGQGSTFTLTLPATPAAV